MSRPNLVATIFVAIFVSVISYPSAANEVPLGLQLPTYNKYIFTKEPQKFYMYTDRYFEGEKSKPWTAGQYGYVRNMRRTDEGVIGTRFHEGVDIRPMKRDEAGRPLDYIRSIARGKVVYVNNVSKMSNYGKYVVVEHDLGNQLGCFYSLYAHLAVADCKEGDPVDAGTVIAKMGYTGAGINRERAHLHLEFNVMAQKDFSDWHNHYFGSPNAHGIYNGLNMNGLNIAELFIKHQSNPKLKMSDFLGRIPVYFKITVPRKLGVPIDIAERYPWMREGNHNLTSPSWEISFASSGFPLAVKPSERRVSKAIVTYVKPTKSEHKYYTKGLLSGTGSSATLTSIGHRVIALICGDFDRIKKKVEE